VDTEHGLRGNLKGISLRFLTLLGVRSWFELWPRREVTANADGKQAGQFVQTIVGNEVVHVGHPFWKTRIPLTAVDSDYGFVGNLKANLFELLRVLGARRWPELGAGGEMTAEANGEESSQFVEAIDGS
jgi:hypothetical protein